MTIEDFGARVASVWAGLRPTTRLLVERALQSTTNRPRAATPYDARAEAELSALLAALDERADAQSDDALNLEQARQLRQMADACAIALEEQAQSAESFAQLIERALRLNDYGSMDALANILSKRLSTSEICELARHTHPVVRALALESLAQASTGTLIGLLADPVDAEVARVALQAQAIEYGSEEARLVINALDQIAEDDL